MIKNARTLIFIAFGFVISAFSISPAHASVVVYSSSTVLSGLGNPSNAGCCSGGPVFTGGIGGVFVGPFHASSSFAVSSVTFNLTENSANNHNPFGHMLLYITDPFDDTITGINLTGQTKYAGSSSTAPVSINPGLGGSTIVVTFPFNNEFIPKDFDIVGIYTDQVQAFTSFSLDSPIFYGTSTTENAPFPNDVVAPDSAQLCGFSTSTYSTDPAGVLKQKTCELLVFLFVPNPAQQNDIALRGSGIWGSISDKVPFGYATIAFSGAESVTSTASSTLLTTSTRAKFSGILDPIDRTLSSALGIIFLFGVIKFAKNIDL